MQILALNIYIKNLMSNTVCPFDKTHILPSDKLKAHIEKCKSPNRSNFQRCRYNPDHWINFSKINEHQKECYRKNCDLSSVISINDDSIIGQFVEALQTRVFQQEVSSFIKEKQQSVFPMNKKKKNKRKEEKEQAETLWKQPNFKQWLIQQYSNKNARRFQQSDQFDD